MEKYIKPAYFACQVEITDVLLASLQEKGENTLGDITGDEGSFELNFNEIF